jgi:FKBP-type peptidyl-prolyl cis-trans isomerase
VDVRLLRSTVLVALAAVLPLALAACGDDSPTSPSNGVFTQTDVTVGTGAEAVAGKKITVHYTGWLWDPSKTDTKGLQFETSRTGDPLVFTLGAGQLIDGFDQGLAGMKVGGVRRLVVPPSMGYGASRNGPIPPNSTLVFEIELLKVE